MIRKGWLGKALRSPKGRNAMMKATRAAEASSLGAFRAEQAAAFRAAAAELRLSMRVRPEDIDALLARLGALPAKVQNEVMGRSADKAMEPMVKAAKAGVPVRRGVLRRAIGKKKAVYQKGRIVDVLVGVRKDVRTDKDWPAKYAHLVEFGTAAHRIKPHAVKMSLGGFEGWIWVTEHPGSRPRPFLRPAFDSTKVAVAMDFERRVLTGVDTVVKGFGL